jgi:hypothetical protein
LDSESQSLTSVDELLKPVDHPLTGEAELLASKREPLGSEVQPLRPLDETMGGVDVPLSFLNGVPEAFSDKSAQKTGHFQKTEEEPKALGF